MTTVKSKGSKTIQVILAPSSSEGISYTDAEMDARAVEAVKVAIAKAKFCKKPVAKYDIEKKQAYLEYENGVRKYVE